MSNKLVFQSNEGEVLASVEVINRKGFNALVGEAMKNMDNNERQNLSKVLYPDEMPKDLIQSLQGTVQALQSVEVIPAKVTVQRSQVNKWESLGGGGFGRIDWDNLEYWKQRGLDTERLKNDDQYAEEFEKFAQEIQESKEYLDDLDSRTKKAGIISKKAKIGFHFKSIKSG